MVGLAVGVSLIVLLVLSCATGLALLLTLRTNRRHLLDTATDLDYIATLTNLSEGSQRRRFDPFVDVNWDDAEHAITPGDPRWVVTHGPLAQATWYRRQPLDRQIAMGMWLQANIAKIAMQFESILIRGFVQYASAVPNGSAEHRYCMHETIEECNHVLMFQELVNRIGFDVPGMPRWMRSVAPIIPLYAGPFPNTFFFGVLAGEIPIDVIQTEALRNAGATHPLVERIMAIHVAEEARHISFADAYLRRRVRDVRWINRLWMSLYVPVVMRVFLQPITVPPRLFFREFGVPRSVRKQVRAGSPQSRQAVRDTFADVRLLCTDLGLMTGIGRLMWRLCGIDGPPSRYRGQPQRAQLPTQLTGVWGPR